MESYVGKSVKEPILDYGPPTNVIDLGEGRRAFQWSISSSGYVPMSTPTSATVYGTGGMTAVYGQSTSYVPYQNDCLDTLTARQQGDDYIIDGFRRPRIMCESPY